MVFALVAQRALEPGRKLAGTRWVAERVAIEGCPGFTDVAAYAGMDFLLDALEEIAEPADTVDDAAARPVEAGTRAFGHSKDHRTDLPQVVIAMAVTRDGVPVWCWTFPGNTADTADIRTVKDDLAGWNLRRLVWVVDRGFASAANRAYLIRGGCSRTHPRHSRMKIIFLSGRLISSSSAKSKAPSMILEPR